MQKLIVAEDLTALGQISLTGALGVLQALAVWPASLPTSLLSTQTEGFGPPVGQKTGDWLEQVLAQWQQRGENFAGALIGYVGQAPLAYQLARWLAASRLPVRMVDPVLGDQGQRYPGMTVEVVVATRELCRQATVLTPNWTELCLLAGVAPDDQPCPEKLPGLITRLRDQGICGRVVVTGMGNATTVMTAYQWGERVQWLTVPRQAGHFYGTGDLFAAILAGGLVKGWSFDYAVRVAQEGIRRAVIATARLSEDDRRYGLITAPALAYLSGLVDDGVSWFRN